MHLRKHHRLTSSLTAAWSRLRGLLFDLGRFLRFGLAVSLVLFSQAGRADVYIFGDSGADQGNYYALPGITPEPGAPYHQGSDGLYRLSNGPMWTELQFPGIRASSDPRRSAGLVNYAVGGAKSDAGFFGGPGGDAYAVGLLSQLDQFDADRAAKRVLPGRDAIAVVYAGTNDLFEGLAGGEDLSGKIAGVTANLQSAVRRLSADGIRTVYVSEIVDFGFAAAFYNTGLPADQEAVLRANLNAVAGAARTSMRTGLAESAAALAGKTNVVVLPLNKLLSAVRSQPGAFGFSNITEAIYDEAAGRLRVSDPKQQAGYFFVDSLHTTARAQRLEGEFYRAFIQATDGTEQRRIGRTVIGALAGLDTISRTVEAPQAAERLRATSDRRWELVLSAPYSHDRVEASRTEPAVSTETNGAMLGLRWPESAEPALSLSLGYLDQDGRVGGQLLRFTQRGPVVSLYNVRTLGAVNVRAEVTHGWLDIETRRNPGWSIPESVGVARGRSNAAVTCGRFVVDRAFHAAGSELTIAGGLAYTRVDRDAYRETGVLGNELAVSRSVYDSLRPFFEARWSGLAWSLGERFTLRPLLSAAVHYEWADRGVGVTGELLDNTAAPVAGFVSLGDRWHWSVAPGVALSLFRHATATLGYRYEEAGRELRQHGVSFSINQRF